MCDDHVDDDDDHEEEKWLRNLRLASLHNLCNAEHVQGNF